MALLDDDIFTFHVFHVAQVSKPLAKGRDPALVPFRSLQRQISEPLNLPGRLRVGWERHEREAESNEQGDDSHRL